MATKTALSQARVLTLGVLLGLVWLVATAFSVFSAMGTDGGQFIGQHVTGGVVGLLVMFGVFALLVALYGELGSETPAPEPWE